MQLGKAIEIRTGVPNLAEALAFYEKLGYQQLADNRVTDGALVIRLLAGENGTPALHYTQGNLDDIRALPLDWQSADTELTLTTPEGVRIVVSAAAHGLAVPADSIIKHTPLSRCGKFGEFALNVPNFAEAAAYWQKLGFNKLFESAEPYPWGIFSDDLIVVGLHQTSKDAVQHDEGEFAAPHITYFAGDMGTRIAALQQDGIELKPFPEDATGPLVNAEFVGPGGQKFFLFEGEI